MARETKKKISEMTVEDKLKNLYKLQTILSEIDEIKTLRGELPLEVQDLEDEIEGLTTRIERLQGEVEELQKEIADHRATIEADKIKVDKYNEQIKTIRDNREFDSLNKEIEYFNLDIDLCQKKIRTAEDSIAQKQEQISSSSALVVERRADLDVKKSELDEIVSETKTEEERLREQAKNLEITIEPRLLTSFKRIRKNSRNGLGIVYVERGACCGCFNQIPPQRQLDIRMRKKIIPCEYCGRIMIDPELAGVKPAETGEEKPKRTRKTATSKKKAE